MLTPIDFSRLETALRTPAYWFELVVVLSCLALAWAIDRRLEALKGNAMALSEKSQGAVESQLDRIEQRIYDSRISVDAANTWVKTWHDGKKAGFDALVIRGACRDPSVLVIDDGRVSLQSADDLWGLPAEEAAAVLTDRLGPRFHSAIIGPAGESRVRYATALGTTDTAAGWRATKANGGVLLDVPSGAPIARGLSMPHSPRWYNGRLWVLESGAGSLAVVDEATGRLETVALLPGFTRTEFEEAAGAEDAASKIPGFTWMESEDVARQAIEGMLAGRRTVVPGVVNKVVSTSGRYTPRTVLLPLIDRFSKSG